MKQKPTDSTDKTNKLKTRSLIIGIAVAALTLGSGTAFAANGSKPGDLLYGVDRATESVQLALSLTSSIRQHVYKSIAEERLLEIEQLLGEKDFDAPGIANALESFESNKLRLNELFDDDGQIDDSEKKLRDELDGKKSSIDKFFEEQQKSLEDQREALKKQYEAALESNDTALADSLKSKIDGFENTLKEAEESREATKQAEEKQIEATKQESENELEDTDKIETQNDSDNKLSEAEKKAQEQQRESEAESED